MPSPLGPTSVLTATCIGFLSAWGVFDWNSRSRVTTPTAHVDFEAVVNAAENVFAHARLEVVVSGKEKPHMPHQSFAAEPDSSFAPQLQSAEAMCPVLPFDFAATVPRHLSSQAKAPTETSEAAQAPNVLLTGAVSSALLNSSKAKPVTNVIPHVTPRGPASAIMLNETARVTDASLRDWKFWIAILVFAFTIPFDLLCGAAILSCVARSMKKCFSQGRIETIDPTVLDTQILSPVAASTDAAETLGRPRHAASGSEGGQASAAFAASKSAELFEAGASVAVPLPEGAARVPERPTQKKKLVTVANDVSTPANAEVAKAKATSRLLRAGFSLNDSTSVQADEAGIEEPSKLHAVSGEQASLCLGALPTPSRSSRVSRSGKPWAKSPGRSRRAND